METATIRQVQHNLAAYVLRVEQGEEIEIRRRTKVVARLVPVTTPVRESRDLEWGNMRKRLHRMWGRETARGKPVSDILYETRGER